MAGTDRGKSLRFAEWPAIVLVEPQLGENIGMTARAMANFGLGELRLVNPRDGWPSASAEAAASGAGFIIERARTFSTLAEAIGDLRLVHAATARPRDMIKEVIGPAEAANRLREARQRNIPSGLLFGRERWGLHNDEIALADAIVTFPVNPGFASLNLAQSVLLMGYELLDPAEASRIPEAFESEAEPNASRKDLEAFLERLESALEEADYFHPPHMRKKMLLNLRGIFANAKLKEPELRTLHGVIASLERRWMRSGRSQEDSSRDDDPGNPPGADGAGVRACADAETPESERQAGDSLGGKPPDGESLGEPKGDSSRGDSSRGSSSRGGES